MKSAKEQFAEIKRGVEEILSEEDLLKKLEYSVKNNKPLTVKVGFDPTAPDLHLGHTVIMNKMAQFQRLGHNIIFLIGDFTGLVGDPSGKSKTRPQLTREDVARNAETYKEQVFKILDKDKTTIKFNSEWLDKMGAHDFIKLTAQANVARMLERDDFEKRYKANESISVHEFMYPLLQAYDSVALKADIEMGGTDQKFNLLLGRNLMRIYDMAPQVCITLPLLVGLDGVNKMSKSLNNYVGVYESADEMFGKLMSLPDNMLRKYYDLLSAKPLPEVENMFTQMESGSLNPKEVKVAFACEIIERFHDKDAAENAKANFAKIFAKKEIPDDIPTHEIQWDGKELWLPKLLTDLNFVKGTSEGKRMVKQGAIKIDQQKAPGENITPPDSFVLQCGKRKFAKINLVKP